jgi:hypothetical protein
VCELISECLALDVASARDAATIVRMTTMEFDLESKLLKVLRKTSRTSGHFSTAIELLIFDQVQLGERIPDLVIVRQLHQMPDNARQIKLTSFESCLVGELIRSGELRPATITRRLYTLPDRVQQALGRLERRGVIEKTRLGGYVLVKDFSTTFEVLSFEAKLTRWKEALIQAKEYQRFSDQSYVALPASVIGRNAKILEACRKSGIGLIAVTRKNIEVILDARSQTRPDPRERTWLLAKTGALRL